MVLRPLCPAQTLALSVEMQMDGGRERGVRRCKWEASPRPWRSLERRASLWRVTRGSVALYVVFSHSTYV